jgi:hypothetical protein
MKPLECRLDLSSLGDRIAAQGRTVMAKCRYWLKMIGASDWPLVDQWVEDRPELLRGVRTPKQPSGISRDDRLVYYSAGSQKLFAIARVSQDGENVAMVPGPGEDRWPYLLPVQVLLAVPTLPLAPHWSVLGLPSTAVQQKSYIELGEDEYQRAWEAITERTRL